MKRLMISLVATIAMSSIAHGYVYSDYNWYAYNGHQYAATFVFGPWEDAQAEAAAIGANLVTINDFLENEWLTETFDGVPIPSHYAVWIGLRKVDGEWAWLSGEPITYWNVCEWCFRNPGPHMYLHTASQTVPGTWNYNNWHDIRPDHYLRGIIEIPIPSVDIDIKPGSDPNCFNINGHGVIPVAINGSEDFSVYDIDVESLSFGGLVVRLRGNRGPLCSIEDWNEDGHSDLVCHFEDDPDNWSQGGGSATLTGTLLDGTPFEGTDSICIVP